MRRTEPAVTLPATAAAWLALAFLVAVAYANSFAGVFQYDDYRVIVDNPQVASLAAWWGSMPGIRPLLKLSYALVEGSGLGLLGHHAVNLALHAANAGLVYLVLRDLIEEPSQARRSIPASAVAFGAAALFAVHPVATEVVTMVSGRSTAMMSCCMLLSVLAHLRGRTPLSLAAFALALASKESAVVLPALLLLLDRLRQPASNWRTALRRLLPHLLVLLAGLLLILLSARYRHHFEVGLATRPPLENLITQSAAVLYLLSRLVMIGGLNVDPVLPVFSAWDAFWLLTSLLSGGLLLSGFLLWPAKRGAAAALIGFFILLAPTNSLLARLDVANERQLYLAAVGFYALAVATLAWLCAGRRVVYWSALGALLVALSVTTLQRNEIYASEVRFWTAVVDKSPSNARAWNNLGMALAGEERRAEAVVALTRAIELAPADYRARFNRRRLCREAAAAAPDAGSSVACLFAVD
jgi:protein O-mannosyl-transferase